MVAECLGALITMHPEMVLPALPKGVNCALLDSLGGGPLKDGWLWLDMAVHSISRGDHGQKHEQHDKQQEEQEPSMEIFQVG